jgi:ring-1,2-phenylacetyl-CoA epoxidase subunit PaaE
VRPRFHRLAVAAVDRLTDDAVAIAFAVPAELRDAYAFSAGQHVTVRRAGPDGGDSQLADSTPRSYSICSTPAELVAHGRFRIGVRQLPGGVFSTFASKALRPGDVLEVLPPLGHFTTAFDPARRRRYAAIAAGSGITPVLSLLATGLATEPASTFTLLYGNRYARSVMFAEELADLKDRYPSRLHLAHILSREQQEARLLSGRLDADRLGELFDSLVPVDQIDEWFLCGPYRMVIGARNVLAARGVPVSSIHIELFHVEEEPVSRPDEEAGADDAALVEVTILLDGRASTFPMRRHVRVRTELPYACRGGVCSTCRARLVSGEVAMAANWALEPDELAGGYVLTCQSSPVSDRLVVDYDA